LQASQAVKIQFVKLDFFQVDFSEIKYRSTGDKFFTRIHTLMVKSPPQFLLPYTRQELSQLFELWSFKTGNVLPVNTKMCEYLGSILIKYISSFFSFKNHKRAVINLGINR
jgi:hypothetical protein